MRKRVNKIGCLLARKSFVGCILFVGIMVEQVAVGQDKETSSNVITGNFSLMSDYIGRGLSQSWGHPVIQGGVDLTMSTGLNAGLWGSRVSENSFPGGQMEIDAYANYGKSFYEHGAWQVGLRGYIYPGANLKNAQLPSRSFNTLEANASLSWDWLKVSYAVAVTDYFGVNVEQGFQGNSKGSSYIEINTSDLPIREKWAIAFHAGRTHVTTKLVSPLPSKEDELDYSDFGVTLKHQLTPAWSANVGMTYATNSDFFRFTESFSEKGNVLNIGGTRGFFMILAIF